MHICPSCLRAYRSARACWYDGTRWSEEASSADLLAGAVLDRRYRLVKRIGQGGLGFVYRAEQVGIGRPVAIKMPYGEALRDPLLVRRFLREARTLASLDHPGIVALIDVGGSEASIPYVVMELLGGEGLDRRLGRVRRLPVGVAVRMIMQLADAVGTAHQAGVVHRDLKPENIRVISREGADETVKVLDFGFARLIDEAASLDPEPLTRQGILLGTPEYMAPELWRGGAIGPAVDLYALGILLFELLSGRLPFEADGGAGLMRLHLEARPPRLELDVASGVVAALQGVLERLLAKSPADRFGSAAELLADLREIDAALRDPRRTRSSPGRPAADTDPSGPELEEDADDWAQTSAAIPLPGAEGSEFEAAPTGVHASASRRTEPCPPRDADTEPSHPVPTSRARPASDTGLLPAVVLALVTLGTLATFVIAST